MDLQKIFDNFNSEFGSWMALTLPNLAAAVTIVVAGVFLSGWAARLVRSAIERNKEIDNTFAATFAAVARYAILMVVGIAALSQLGVETTSMLAALGAAGLAIGLALQNTLSNIAAGFMLLWLRPFRVGDFIECNGVSGTIHEVKLFATEIYTYDNVYQFVPNSELWSHRITNFSRLNKRMVDLSFSIAYGDDISQARKILIDLAKDESRVFADPEPMTFTKALGDSAVEISLRVWCKTSDYWGVRRALTENGKIALEDNGLTIPFPQLDVHTVPGEATQQ